MRRIFLLALPLLLAACSVSVTVPLPDQRVVLAGLPEVWGRVVYPVQPLEFPAFPAKRVEVSGVIEASQPLTLSLDLYARLEDPAQDSHCLALGNGQAVYAYACPVGPEDGWVGSAAFASEASAPLSLKGENLNQGVQRGRLWLGLAVGGGSLPASLVELTFKELKATVTVGF